jgi:hypothetical protein
MPRPPYPAAWSKPKGSEWVAEPETTGLRWVIEAGGRCRWGSPSRGYCRRPAVAKLDRRPSSTDGRAKWWRYCERHLYGRWIEDGQVYYWRLRPVAA